MGLDIKSLCTGLNDPIRQVISCIENNRKGIALVTDEAGRLINTITDGDVRRVILSGASLEMPVSELLAIKRRLRRAIGGPDFSDEPVTAPAGSDRADLLTLMREEKIRQLPLVDEEDVVCDLVIIEDLLPEEFPPVRAMIMAGGQGARLRPLTDDMPKPMLLVGDRPLMERTIEQLRRAGIKKVNITTHYRTEQITEYFGDGREFGVELGYVTEEQPLGTAGGLGLMEAPDEPLLVINGDILTRVDFRAMLDFHREQQAKMTVAVRRYDLQVPYGVVECRGQGQEVSKIEEKPQLKFLVNAGIYLLEPSIHRFIPNGERFDMTDLIERLLAEGLRVVSFPIVEYWLDIGQQADYEQAQKDMADGLLTPGKGTGKKT